MDNLKNKTVEQLRHLVELGYCYFYFGMESGDDKLLKRMNKGYTSDVIVDQCKKMDEAGMPYIGNFLGGLGGHNYGLSHARESARVINQLKPAMIYASELTLFPDTPLSAEVDAGTFEEATELERIQELQEFIRCLTTETIFRAEHVTIPVPIYGKVPQDNDKMIAKLQRAIDENGEENLRNYRKHIFGL